MSLTNSPSTDMDGSVSRITVEREPATLGEAVSRSSYQQESAFLRERIQNLQAELTAALEREAAVSQQYRDLEASIGETEVPPDQQALVAKTRQLEKDLQAFRSGKQSVELALIEARNAAAEAQSQLAASQSTIEFRLGTLLARSLSSWSDFLALFRNLRQLRSEARQARVEGLELDPLVPLATAAEYNHIITKAKEKAEAEGPSAAAEWAKRQGYADPVLGRVLIELAKDARKTHPSEALALAQDAIAVQPHEQRIKLLAIMMMDAGEVTSALDVLRAAVAAGASLNATESTRLDSLQALERVKTQGVRLPRPRVSTAPSDPRKILALVPQSLPFHWNAASTRAVAFAQSAAAAGFTVELVTPPGYPPRKNDDEPDSRRREIVESHVFHRLESIDPGPASMDRYAEAAGAALAQLARDIGAATIVSPFDPPLTYAGAIGARAANARFVIDCSQIGGFEAEDSERATIVRHLERQLLAEADLVVARSRALNDALAQYGVPSDRLRMSPDRSPVFKRDPVRRGWREDPALNGRTVIGYIGDPSEDLDFEALPDILELLVRRGLNVGLAVFAVGTRIQKLKSIAESKGCGDRILVPGRPRLGSIAEAFETLDIFVAPAAEPPIRGLRARTELVDAIGHGVCVAGTDAAQPEEGPGSRMMSSSDWATLVGDLVADADRRRALAEDQLRKQRARAAEAQAEPFAWIEAGLAQTRALSA